MDDTSPAIVEKPLTVSDETKTIEYVQVNYYDEQGNLTGSARIDGGDLSEVVSSAVSDSISRYGTEDGNISVVEGDTSEGVGDYVVVNTASVIVVASLFLVAGAVCIRTLLRSFER